MNLVSFWDTSTPNKMYKFNSIVITISTMYHMFISDANLGGIGEL